MKERTLGDESRIGETKGFDEGMNELLSCFHERKLQMGRQWNPVASDPGWRVEHEVRRI